MIRRIEIWVPIGLSFVAILIAALSLYISYDQLRKSEEKFSIAKHSENVEISVATFDQPSNVELSVTRRIIVVNSSTSPAAIASVSCESHPHVARAMQLGRVVIHDGCKIYVRNEHDTYIPAAGPINFLPGEAIAFRLEAILPAPEVTKERLRGYYEEHEKFDEQNFLLFLAARGSDFFGSTFGARYDYLQQNVGQNLCLGASVTFDAVTATGSQITYNFDYYVGPMMPVVSCSGKTITLEYSDAFKDDLFNPSRISPIDARLLQN